VTWCNVVLKQLAQVSVSNVDKKSAEGEIPVRLVNYTDVYYGDRLSPALALMRATATAEQIQTFRLRCGDVLLTKDSETTEDIGIAAYVDSASEEMVLGYHLSLLRPKPDIISGRFLYWAMCGGGARGQLAAGATGVTRFGLRESVIGSVVVAVPPIKCQRAIADFLETETARIDALVAKRRQAIELLKERLAAAVVSRLAPLEPRLPLKRSWKVRDCKHRTPEYVDMGYPVVSPGDVTPGRLDLTRAHRFVGRRDYEDLADAVRRPKRGDIIYSRNASIGIAAYVDTDARFCMGQDVCLITSRDQDQRYLTHVLNSIGVTQLEKLKIGSTFSRVNIAQIVELEIPTPELSVQQRLADEFDGEQRKHHQLVKALSNQIALLQERRQALITAAVTGDIEVPGVPM
jgi:type I restriction enzyme S subunit